MPFGSWILLRGSEKNAIISPLAEVYDLNADLPEVAQQQIPDKGGYLRKVIPFFIADTKAQVILGGCSSFKARSHRLLAVGEKSGNDSAQIWLRDGDDCRGVAVGGDDLPDRAPPPSGPPIMGCMVCSGKCTIVPFLNRPFESEIHGTVIFTQFCCVLLVTWCYRVFLSCYLPPK